LYHKLAKRNSEAAGLQLANVWLDKTIAGYPVSVKYERPPKYDRASKFMINDDNFEKFLTIHTRYAH